MSYISFSSSKKKKRSILDEWPTSKTTDLCELRDFVIKTILLLKTRPALSWDQALLSFRLVDRFPESKANRKVAHADIPELRTYVIIILFA